MKKINLLLIVILCISFSSFAQKFAFVDTDYVLENIPAYESAQDQLDQLSIDWQKEIEQKYTEINQLYKEYQTEKVLMSEEMKVKKEDQIIQKEKFVKELQKKRFNPNDGDLFKKRQELVKPIQDQVYNAIKEIVEETSYQLVMDTANNAKILYYNTKYDISDLILKKMGYK